jgi:hypothetical protein
METAISNRQVAELGVDTFAGKSVRIGVQGGAAPCPTTAGTVKQESVRSLVDARKVKRTGTDKKGDPYQYQNASTQIPDMDAVPGNQNTKNDGNDE